MSKASHFFGFSDKFLHILAGWAVTSFFYTLSEHGFHANHPAIIGMCFGILAGAGKEFLDWLAGSVQWAATLHRALFREPTGDPNWPDFLCTAGASVVTAYLTHLIIG